MTSTCVIQESIIDWLQQRPAAIVSERPLPDEDIYRAGWVDSFGLIELIGYLEASFAVSFADSDFGLADFRTVGGLARLIQRHQANV